MKVMLVAGARPNFMKIAPVHAALTRTGHDVVLVHTGQHYDTEMSGAFFSDLRIPAPDFHLEVGSGSHAVQTARVMQAFEPVFLEVQPDWVLVPGDVNSTLACALTVVKLKEQTGSRIAHLEAGLRSNDWRMPEEINRVLTDRVSDLLLTPSEDAAANLQAEGIDASRIAFVGNVMIDTLLQRLPDALQSPIHRQLNIEDAEYAVATLHRPSNVDDAHALETCLNALRAISLERPVVFPLHPRTRKQIETFGLSDALKGLITTPPLGYMEMLALTARASLMLTDSGGLQEETTALGVPCVTLREQTERPITITEGTNRLAPWPLSAEGILAASREALSTGRLGADAPRPSGWDGHASERCVAALEAAMNAPVQIEGVLL